jgi:gliding motility-associated-like protein
MANAQWCDMEILGFDPVTLEITLAVNGAECGTEADSIGEFILGLTFDPPVPAEENPFDCFYQEGFSLLLFPLDFPFVNIGQGSDEIIQQGDTLSFNIIESQPFGFDASLCWQEAINSGAFDECITIYIHQINDSDSYYGDSGLGGFPYPDLIPENNTLTFSFTDACDGLPPPPLDGGCTDEDAINYDEDADFDDGSCLFVDLSIPYTLIQFGCDTATFDWTFQPDIKVFNFGDVMPDEYCIDVFLNGESEPYQTECYDTSISYGEFVLIEMPTYFPEQDGYNIPLESIAFVLSNVEGDSNPNNDDIFVDAIGIIYPNDCIIEGCTDESASNYDPEANVDDGSCEYPVLGCTDPEALNYNPLATEDDGSCEYPILDAELELLTNAGLFCDTLLGEYFIPVVYFINTGNVPITSLCAMYSTNVESVFACDYQITYEGEQVLVIFPEIYEQNNGEISVEILSINGFPVEGNLYTASDIITFGAFECIEGCMDENALNYNPLAQTEDGSCQYEGNPNEDCDDPPLYIPNVFSPNNDGKNDYWKAVTPAECWRQFELIVFNRWGEIVWQTDDPNAFWLGEGEGLTHHVADGVYVYKVSAVGYDVSNWVVRTGHVTIFR